MSGPSPLSRPVYPDERRPWGLILCLIVALVVGLIGLPLQFFTYRQLSQVSKTEQLRDGQRAICEQLNDLAAQADLTPVDCSRINAEP